MELIEQLNGQHTLVFFNFRYDCGRLVKALSSTKLLVMIYTQTKDEIDVLLSHYASCGYGLNLQHLIVQGCMDKTVIQALHDKSDMQNALMTTLKARISRIKGD